MPHATGRTYCGAVALVCAIAAAARGQVPSASDPQSNTKVRVTGDAGLAANQSIGTLAALLPDTIVFRPDGAVSAIAVPLRANTRIEVQVHSRTSHPFIGAALGILAGSRANKGHYAILAGGVGLVAGLFIRTENSSWHLLPVRNERVRISGPGIPTQIGTILALRSDSVVIRSDSLSTRISVARDMSTRIDVASGTRSAAREYGLSGLLIGGIGGAVLSAATFEKPSGFCLFICNSGDAAIFGGVTGAVVGGVIGLGIGMVSRGTNWVPAPLEGVRMSVSPAPGAGRNGFSLSLARSLQF